MFQKTHLIVVVFLPLLCSVQSASLLERSYEYVKSMGQAYAPSLMDIARCVSEDEVWECAKEKAGKMLDLWQKEVDTQRRSWAEAADVEVAASGRAVGTAEAPSRIGGELESSVQSLVDLLQNSFARAMGRKKEGGSIDTITLSTSNKKKMKKKKKPQPIHIVQADPQMMMMLKKMKRPNKGRQLETRRIPVQSWVIGHPETHAPAKDDQKKPARVARNVAWTPISSQFQISKVSARKLDENASEDRLDDAKSDDRHLKVYKDGNIEAVVENGRSVEARKLNEETQAISNALNDDNDQSRDIGEQRGKKKKKKKAILKLLLLGAVAKAKIGLLLQILSAKLQVKFFLIALAGLAINVARFWLDLKKGHSPQKVIYYEHAQHQHHYEHDDDEAWGGGHGGYWSRSLDALKKARRWIAGLFKGSKSKHYYEENDSDHESVFPSIVHEQDESPHDSYAGHPYASANHPYRSYAPRAPVNLS